MSTQVQYRSGTSAENDAFTGAPAEITVDTTNSTLRVHDGILPGGVTLLTANNTATLTNKTLEDATFTGTVTGNLIPSANIIYDLGNSSNYWNNLYLAGNTIFLGSLQLRQVNSTTFGVFTGDGVTQADIDVGNIDVAAINQGLSVIGIAGANGNAYVNVNNVANVLVVTSSGANVTGYVTASGNITGDYIFGNGSQLQGIDATSIQNGTSNVRTFLDSDVTISSAGASNVLVVGSLGPLVNGTLTMNGNIDVGNGYIVNLSDPVDAQDAATKAYVDSVSSSGFTIEDDTANTTVVSGGDTLQLFGTANEVSVLITDTDQITVGLPANVTVSGTLSAANVDASTTVNTDSITGTVLTVTADSLEFDLTGNVTLNSTWINRVNNPLQAQDAATKQYVDDAVSSGIHIHNPVLLETPGALPSATYTQGGTTYTVTDTVAANTVVFSTAANLQVNDQLWFSSSFEGIVANVAYFVVSAPNTSAAVLSTAYNGEPVANITANTGLSESVRVNSGVGATLTATANGALTVDGFSTGVGNRILVYNQITQYENGVYAVTDAGNVTAPWILTRATDSDRYVPDTNDGIDQGSYFFVQSGDTGAGESYILTQPTGPFIIGLDAIEFTQFSASQVYSANTQAGLVLNGTVFSAQTDGVTTDFDAGGNIRVRPSAQLTTPNIGAATGTSVNVTGNITGDYFFGNGSQLTGIDATSIQNGTANVRTFLNGDVATSAGGTANVLVVTATGANVTGYVTATGNITGDYFFGNGSQLQGIDATSIQNGTANVRTFLNGNVAISAAGVANVLVISAAQTTLSQNIASQYATVTTSVANSQVTLDSWSLSSYRSAKYYCQVTSGSDYQVIELSMVHDASNVYLSQYGEIVTSSSLGNFDASISGGNVDVRFTPVNAVSTVRASATLIAV